MEQLKFFFDDITINKNNHKVDTVLLELDGKDEILLKTGEKEEIKYYQPVFDFMKN